MCFATNFEKHETPTNEFVSYICHVKKHFLLFILFIAAKAYCFAQLNDAQLWENIYLEKNITKRWLVRMNHEGRISDNITNPNFYYFDIGVNYDYSKHFHFSLAYVIGQKEQNAFNEAWSLSLIHI